MGPFLRILLNYVLRFAIQTHVLPNSVNISETVVCKKSLNSARQEIGPKSYLTVNSNLQNLQMLSGHVLKYTFLARILDEKLCTRVLLTKCTHIVFVTSLVEK